MRAYLEELSLEAQGCLTALSAVSAQTPACHGLGDWEAEDMSDGTACSQQVSFGSPPQCSWMPSPHSTPNKRQQSVYATLIRNSLPEGLLGQPSQASIHLPDVM